MLFTVRVFTVNDSTLSARMPVIAKVALRVNRSLSDVIADGAMPFASRNVMSCASGV